MAEYDVLDEAIIHAKPDVVYKALLAEYSGETRWWMPYLEGKPRGGGAVDQLGALIDTTLHGKFTIKFTAKTAETKKNELWHLQYVEGDFLGEGTWKLEASGENTKLSFRWRCRPARLLLRIMGPIVNIPKQHSKVMKAGFAGLDAYIKKSSKA
jgi:hypothetical protein